MIIDPVETHATPNEIMHNRQYQGDSHDMSEATESIIEQVQNLIEEHHGVIRTKELGAAGISYKQVLKMVADGTLLRAKSGYYTLKEKSFVEEELLISLFSDTVLTMESALYVHGYIDTKPEIWQLAVNKNTSKTRFVHSPVPVEPYYTEERVLAIGAQTITLEALRMPPLRSEEKKDGAKEDEAKEGNGNLQNIEKDTLTNGKASIRIYGIDRLICDILKYEEKLDRQIFKTALRTYISDPHKDVARLLSYAKERKVLKKVQTMIGVWL